MKTRESKDSQVIGTPPTAPARLPLPSDPLQLLTPTLYCCLNSICADRSASMSHTSIALWKLLALSLCAKNILLTLSITSRRCEACVSTSRLSTCGGAVSGQVEAARRAVRARWRRSCAACSHERTSCRMASSAACRSTRDRSLRSRCASRVLGHAAARRRLFSCSSSWLRTLSGTAGASTWRIDQAGQLQAQAHIAARLRTRPPSPHLAADGLELGDRDDAHASHRRHSPLGVHLGGARARVRADCTPPTVDSDDRQLGGLGGRRDVGDAGVSSGSDRAQAAIWPASGGLAVPTKLQQ